VTAKEIDRLRGGAHAEHQMSARNRFSGIVRDVRVEGLMAQVEMVVTEPATLTAIVTADAVQELGIKPGNHVVAVIKSTSVMVER
jgi:molybdopterin-binding protein